MKKKRKGPSEFPVVALVLLLYFVAGATALMFQSGHTPHWLTVGNGETVVAYTNGVVYTNSQPGFQGSKRTLLQTKDGAIVSFYDVVGPGPLIYSSVPLPATPEEVAKWKRAQEILRRCVECL